MSSQTPESDNIEAKQNPTIDNKLTQVKEITFPDNCIRGISDPNWVNEDDEALSGMFQFNHASRDDGWVEESINWEDNDQVRQFTLDQIKDGNGTLQFRIGYAIIPRVNLDFFSSLPMVKGYFNYERAPISGNPYHGNLLIIGDPAIIRRLKGNLATYVSVVKRR